MCLVEGRNKAFQAGGPLGKSTEKIVQVGEEITWEPRYPTGCEVAKSQRSRKLFPFYVYPFLGPGQVIWVIHPEALVIRVLTGISNDQHLLSFGCMPALTLLRVSAHQGGASIYFTAKKGGAKALLTCPQPYSKRVVKPVCQTQGILKISSYIPKHLY